MKKRCYYPKHICFNSYGGRGIKICDEWNDRQIVKAAGVGYTKGFLAFRKWALENGYAEDLTIDRIDVNKNYEPTNCRWVSKKTQSNNKRNNKLITYNGKTQSLKLWCEELNLPYNTIKNRVSILKWDCKKAFETPIKKRTLF